MSLIKRICTKTEIDLGDSIKNGKFLSALQELVAILFAVVFGVGLAEFKSVGFNYDAALLLLAYITIVLSWWGYHRGIIIGPKETNVLSYAIDCLLVGVYWALINIREPIQTVTLFYTIMFGLYFIWEIIRLQKNDVFPPRSIFIKRAAKCNGIFFIISGAFYFSHYPYFDEYRIFPYIGNVLFLIIIVSLYRVILHFLYKHSKQPLSTPETDLIELAREAKEVTEHAKPKLSNFPVGAAVLSDKGNIYTGCNIEYENYSNTIHAEEAAIASLIASGDSFPVAIAVYTETSKTHFPCGKCLQSIYEIGGSEVRVISVNKLGISDEKSINDLLPYGFRLE